MAKPGDWESVVYLETMESHAYPVGEGHMVAKGDEWKCPCDPQLIPLDVHEGLLACYRHNPYTK